MRRQCAWIAVWALVVALVSCQPGQPQAKRSPAPRQSGTPAATPDPQRCARLAKLGFAQCPPMPDQIEVPKTTIKNLTNGAIDDATAQTWGRAFQQTEGYYRWAMKTNARDALTSGAFADPAAAANLFGYDLRDLDSAHQQGGQLVDEWEVIPRVHVVAVPDELQQAMRRQGLKPKPFAIAAEFRGPTKRLIRAADGHENTLTSADSSFAAGLLVWGELTNDADLGSIWYQYGVFGCEGPVKSVCQL